MRYLSRRNFVKTIATAAAGMGTAGLVAPHLLAAEHRNKNEVLDTERSRPNVLFLFSDQHRADMMGCAGSTLVKTPTFDRLSREGVRFTRAYCQDGICVPSRTSMMSGLYARTTGCLHNRDNPVSPERFVMLQHAFQANGYRTGCFGKRHLPFQNDSTMCKGWDASATTISPKLDPSDENYFQWLKDNGLWELRMQTTGDNIMNSDLFCMISPLEPDQRDAGYTARKSIDFLRENKDRPFFCWASFHGPHQPYTPPAKWADLYPIENMPLPESIDEPIENLPPTLQSWRRNEKQPWNLGTAAKNKRLYQQYIAFYCAQVTEVDHYAGEILRELDRLGLRENTLVIYASDHGDFVGRHGMSEKCSLGHNVYEDTLRVPLIISWPSRFPQGQTVEELVELLDLYPTLVELLSLELPSHAQKLEGRSLVPKLTEGRPIERTYAISENWSQLTVITDRYKLGTWIDPGPIPFYKRHDRRGKFPDMLFDREKHPLELDNLIGSSEEVASLDATHSDVEKVLRGYIAEWTAKVSDSGRQELIDEWRCSVRNESGK